MPDETYDEGRARNLVALLRAMSERIRDLDQSGRLLSSTTELMRLEGDVKSELFHYEDRVAYDTPDIAESRRIVEDVTQESETPWQTSESQPDKEKPR